MRIACLAFALTIIGCGSDATSPSGMPGGFVPPDAGAGGDDASVPLTPTGNLVGTLGAIPYDGGVSFRLWAPNADQVSVSGDFNQWTGAAMQPSDGGVFSLDVPGAQPGQSYRYLVESGGQTLTRDDPRARAVGGASGPSIIVDPSFAWSGAFQPPDRSSQVMYELHIGTFNPPPNTVAGNFATTQAKLDYLADLGINMIELMPPNEFPTTTSWGYNPSLPFATATAYGSPDDFRALVDAAHARGIGVIVDVVHNHYNGRELPCFDATCPSTNKNDHGIYFYSGPTLANTPWGPRPSFATPEVRDYIRDHSLMLLGEYRVDGMRWDSVSNIRGINNGASANADGQMMLIDIMKSIHMQFPNSLQIAEDLQTIDYVTQKTSVGGLGFDSQWDAAFFHPIDDTVVASADSSRSMSSIASAISHRYNNAPLQRVVYSEDHDEVANGRSRIPEMISPGDAGSLQARLRSTLAAVIVMTSPGIPMIFMGQEFLENGHFSDTNPLDWTKTTTYAGILQEYKDLIALRKNVAGQTLGLTGDGVNVFHVNDTAKVIAYHRWKSGGVGDDVVVVANFSSTTFTSYVVGLPRAGTWHVRLASDSTKYSSDYANTPAPDVTTTPGTRDNYEQSGMVQLGPYEAVILSQ